MKKYLSTLFNKKLRSKLSIILAFVLLVTGISTSIPIYASENTSNITFSESMNDLVIKSENSFGNLLASELDAKLNEQKENNGCNIFSIEVNGKEAAVSFETVQDCTLVIGIYDEAGEKMLASGSKEVLIGETDVAVSIEADSMPQYFYVKGFLVDTSSFRPLCIAYESPNYTKEMQEFFAKTTDDFAQDKVINFDDDKTSNFAVFSESTKVIQESAVSNQVVRADDEQNVYVIENADSNITSLKVGEVFAHQYEDSNILIVKIASIQIDGTTVTITGEETSLEEVFDYVKIEGESKTEDAVVDTSNCEEGVVYNGLIETQYRSLMDNEEVVEGGYHGLEVEGKIGKTFSVDVVDKKIGSDDNNVKVNGGINLGVECIAKAYVSLSYSYMELKIDYSAQVNFSISGNAHGEIPLISLGFLPVHGVVIEFTPTVIVEASAELDLTGKLSGTVGFSVSSKDGTKNLTSTPTFQTTVKMEGEIYIGISLEPKIKVISDKLVKVSMTGKAGAEVTAFMKYEGEKESTVIHECKNCIDGDISGKYELSFGVKFLNWDKLEFKCTILDETVKIADFYYSFDFDEFNLTICPHYLYKVSVTVVDLYGNLVNGAMVNEQNYTDENGKTSFYLSNGSYGLVVQKDESIVKRNVKIQGEAQRVTVWMRLGSGTGNERMAKMVSMGSLHSGAVTKDGSLYMWGWNRYGQLGNGTMEGTYIPIQIMENIKTVSLCDNYSVAVTRDGKLYTWGKNENGRLGNGTLEDSLIPIKILENVETVSLVWEGSAAITKDGSLYMWGWNGDGKLGNGTTENSLTPIKVLENVETVSLGNNHNGAVTKDGSLYMWGGNSYGQLGNGTTENSLTPIKILENVETVSLGNDHSGAVTKDGSLYMWGGNSYGQLGNGTTDKSLVPIKIMENVKTVSLGNEFSVAITKDGKLYTWGDNPNGRLGNGTTEESHVPIKIMENVKTVSLGSGFSAAITWDEELYTWGWGGDSQLGNGTMGINCLTPKKIMENVEIVNWGTMNGGAITTGGYLYMWGKNGKGQLGNGTTDVGLIPTKIEFPSESTYIVNSNTQSSFQQESYEMVYKSASADDVLTQLVPNETYNFYIMKSDTEDNALAADNLLYISQAVSNGEGKLNLTYESKETYENAKTFAVAMHQNNISLAQVELNNLTYNGTEQYINPVVTYNGTTLTEGKDYELYRDYSALDAGEYTVVIFGIGSYFGTKEVNYSVVGNSQPSQPDPVRDFVNRLYTLVLEREADEGGLDSWTNVLLNHQSSGVDAGYGFVFSEECRERNLSNEDFVETLYNTFMNRSSDEGGKSAWVSQLDAGVEREKIFEGFVYSQEFALICADYGINMGDVQDVDPLWTVLQNYRNRNADITKFVARCYTEALERNYETEGLESWCRVIHERTNTPKQVAQNFIFSDEFTQKNLNNEEYVKVLYRTFMGREADEGGLNAWVEVLKSGREDRAKVLEGFSDSVEFAEILQQFGLR